MNPHGRSSCLFLAALATVSCGCAPAGYLETADPAGPVQTQREHSASAASHEEMSDSAAKAVASALTAAEALSAFAPIIAQEVGSGPLAVFDLPISLDFDRSGTLRDDAASLRAMSTNRRLSATPPPTAPSLYGHASADHNRFYLFYALYYAADVAADGTEIDHRGDLEGALVIVLRRDARVEAVVTHAHRLHYLWLPAVARPSADPDIERAGGEQSPPAHPARRPRWFRDHRGDHVRDGAASGVVPLDRAGRPVLFAERGGHGIYAFSHGAWHPRGGTDLPLGPAGTPDARLVWILPPGASIPSGAARAVSADLLDLGALAPFLTLGGTRLAGLPLIVKSPGSWRDRRGGRMRGSGRMLKDPASFFEDLKRSRRP